MTRRVALEGRTGTMPTCALVLTALAAACGAPLPEDAPTPTPTPSDDVRERVVAALEQPGTVTQVRATSVQESTGAESVIRAWIDLRNERSRYEQLQRGEPDYVSIIAEGTEATYIRDFNQFSEHPFVLSEEFTADLPPPLHNPALRGMWPLALSLWQSEWRPAGSGEWEGTPATLWEADFPGPEGPMHTHTTIYLDAETDLPLGEVFQFSQSEGEPPQSKDRVTYEIAFVPLDEFPPDTFDRGALRELTESFGGLLDSAKAMDFTALWLGQTAGPREGLPDVPLASINIRREGEPDGPYVAFHYRDTSSPREHHGNLSIISRPDWAWERMAEQHPGVDWWEDEERQLVTIDGVEAAYVIGQRPQSSPASRPAVEMIILLPNSVVRVGATPTIGHDGEDRNPFNDEAAMEAVLQELRVLE